jgi:hypothetical protein
VLRVRVGTRDGIGIAEVDGLRFWLGWCEWWEYRANDTSPVQDATLLTQENPNGFFWLGKCTLAAHPHHHHTNYMPFWGKRKRAGLVLLYLPIPLSACDRQKGVLVVGEKGCKLSGAVSGI